MELSVAGTSFLFQLNPAGTRYVAPITLVEWEPFRSKNTVPGREGQHVLLECPMVYGETEEGKLADRPAYIRSLEYFLSHRTELHQHVVAAAVDFAQRAREIKEKYEVDLSELPVVARPEDLYSLIDLSYVQLFPYHEGGVPFLGFRFECNWDEYGFLAVLVGTETLACGYSGTAQAVDLSIRETVA